MNKKIAAGVAVTLTAASIATNLLVEPEELLHSADYLANAKLVELAELEETDLVVEEEAKKTRLDALRDRIIRLPVAVKAVFLLPLWALGAIPVTIGTAVFSALAPIWTQVLGVLAQAGILVGVFCLGYKLLFPKKKVRDLFKKRNFRWLLLGAGSVSVANVLLTAAWSGWPVLRAVVMALVGFGVLCLLWGRIARKIKPEEPDLVQTRLKLEY